METTHSAGSRDNPTLGAPNLTANSKRRPSMFSVSNPHTSNVSLKSWRRLCRTQHCLKNGGSSLFSHFHSYSSYDVPRGARQFSPCSTGYASRLLPLWAPRQHRALETAALRTGLQQRRRPWGFGKQNGSIRDRDPRLQKAAAPWCVWVVFVEDVAWVALAFERGPSMTLKIRYVIQNWKKSRQRLVSCLAERGKRNGRLSHPPTLQVRKSRTCAFVSRFERQETLPKVGVWLPEPLSKVPVQKPC